MNPKNNEINYKGDYCTHEIIWDNIDFTVFLEDNFYRKKKILKLINKYYDKKLFTIGDRDDFYILMEANNNLYFIFDINIDKIDNNLLGKFLEEFSLLPNFVDYKIARYELAIIVQKDKNNNKDSINSSYSNITILSEEVDFILIE